MLKIYPLTSHMKIFKTFRIKLGTGEYFSWSAQLLHFATEGKQTSTPKNYIKWVKSERKPRNNFRFLGIFLKGSLLCSGAKWWINESMNQRGANFLRVDENESLTKVKGLVIIDPPPKTPAVVQDDQVHPIILKNNWPTAQDTSGRPGRPSSPNNTEK